MWHFLSIYFFEVSYKINKSSEVKEGFDIVLFFNLKLDPNLSKKIKISNGHYYLNKNPTLPLLVCTKYIALWKIQFVYFNQNPSVYAYEYLKFSYY